MDPKTTINSMMYPDWQFLSGGAASSFESRILFIRTLRVERRSTCVVPPLGRVSQTAALNLLVGGWLVAVGFTDRKAVKEAAENLVGQARELVGWK